MFMPKIIIGGGNYTKL